MHRLLPFLRPSKSNKPSIGSMVSDGRVAASGASEGVHALADRNPYCAGSLRNSSEVRNAMQRPHTGLSRRNVLGSAAGLAGTLAASKIGSAQAQGLPSTKEAAVSLEDPTTKYP